MNKTVSRTLLAAALLWPCLSSAQSDRRYVNIQVYRNGSTNYTVMEGGLPVNLHINAFGGSFSFSGIPIHGNVSQSGSYFNISGADIYGHFNSWGGNYRVEATLTSGGDAGRYRQLSFTLYAGGRSDDPHNPPHYSIQDNSGSTSLHASPQFGGQGYTITGYVEMDRFGPAGTALTGLVTAIALHNTVNPRKQQAAPLPATLPLGVKPGLKPLPFPL